MRVSRCHLCALAIALHAAAYDSATPAVDYKRLRNGFRIILIATDWWSPYLEKWYYNKDDFYSIVRENFSPGLLRRMISVLLFEKMPETWELAQKCVKIEDPLAARANPWHGYEEYDRWIGDLDNA